MIRIELAQTKSGKFLYNEVRGENVTAMSCMNDTGGYKPIFIFPHKRMSAHLKTGESVGAPTIF